MQFNKVYNVIGRPPSCLHIKRPDRYPFTVMPGLISCCFSRRHRQEQAEDPCQDDRMMTMATSTYTGKGKPLRFVKIKWKASPSISRSEFERQRREFWETAPAFGGKEEIWNALKGAIDVWERDLELAKAIIECAGIVLPSGELTEVYDELGFKYNIPNYCLAEPGNLVEDECKSRNRLERNSSQRSLSFSEDGCGRPKELRVRLNTGTDLMVPMKPSTATIFDLNSATLKKANLLNGEKLLFFYSGQGPLQGSTKLDDLPKLDSGKVPIQAWIKK